MNATQGIFFIVAVMLAVFVAVRVLVYNVDPEADTVTFTAIILFIFAFILFVTFSLI